MVLLGAIVLSPEAADEVLGTIDPSDFYNYSHQLIFENVRALRREGIAADSTTLAERLDANGQLEDAGGVLKIAEVMETVPHSIHAKYYANIVREHADRRRLIQVCREAIEDAYDRSKDLDTHVSKAESGLQVMYQLIYYLQILYQVARSEHKCGTGKASF